MGTMLLKLDKDTDLFLTRECARLAEHGKISLRSGKLGVVVYLLAQAKENEKNGGNQNE